MQCKSIEKIIAEQKRKLEAAHPISGPEGQPMTDAQMREVSNYIERADLFDMIDLGLLGQNQSYVMSQLAELLSKDPARAGEFYDEAWECWCGDSGCDMFESVELTAQEWLEAAAQ